MIPTGVINRWTERFARPSIQNRSVLFLSNCHSKRVAYALHLWDGKPHGLCIYRTRTICRQKPKNRSRCWCPDLRPTPRPNTPHHPTKSLYAIYAVFRKHPSSLCWSALKPERTRDTPHKIKSKSDKIIYKIKGDGAVEGKLQSSFRFLSFFFVL